MSKLAIQLTTTPLLLRKPCKLFAGVARVCQRQLGFLVEPPFGDVRLAYIRGTLKALKQLRSLRSKNASVFVGKSRITTNSEYRVLVQISMAEVSYKIQFMEYENFVVKTITHGIPFM